MALANGLAEAQVQKRKSQNFLYYQCIMIIVSFNYSGRRAFYTAGFKRALYITFKAPWIHPQIAHLLQLHELHTSLIDSQTNIYITPCSTYTSGTAGTITITSDSAFVNYIDIINCKKLPVANVASRSCCNLTVLL